ncbi:hypothetical protein GPEL0_01f1396 [Geoanaerobacter pelophilus]|uniref:Uncharacterized protein n=1 Tax=Geoanaerobacter pelophilus TaxID=60036 RepID=A0ABQ0MGG9_9BACT|nr:hypothetical protein [Geoanaerobacter pelophilus]GAW66152.1 hypothetical protein GPEL0_01f1396 [Geoanaerobacter pelophilus]
MLRFFKSIFRRNPGQGRVPESLVKAAIERAVDGTDPWIRAVSGYKKKLRPAVLHAIDHVISLVDQAGPPVNLDRKSYDSDPLLRSFFISAADLERFLERDPCLAELRKNNGEGGHAFALLLMEKRERATLGAEVSGEVVLRDVPQVSVSFESHRLLDVSLSEEQTRYQLKRRAYDHLLEIALGMITETKMRRGKLEKHRTLLESKLALLHRGGWGFDESGDEKIDAAEVEDKLAQIEAQLLEIGKEDKVLDLYLALVADVLGNAELHLWAGSEALVVDRMGIKRKEAAAGAKELPLQVMGDSQGRRRVVALVALTL